MRQLSCNIQIGQYVFTNASEVAIKSSFENLTDTATITIARKLKFDGQLLAGDSGIFKRGDAVRISLGYDFANELIFSGYLVDIKPGSPLELRCEDEMFQLKKGAIKKTLPGATLKSVLAFIAPGYPIKSVEADLGDFRIVNETPAQVLSRLRREYGFKSWFRDGTLYAGLAFWPELQATPRFTFQKDIIEYDLTFQDKETVRVKVKAISMNRDNTKTEIELGDPDGEQRTLTYYNKSTADLNAAAKRDLEQFRFTGFRGSFKSFGTPVVKHGDKVELVDPIIPDRNGVYIAQSVETSFGMSGYKQTIELGTKV